METPTLFQRLPNELFYHICSYLDIYELDHFILTSKGLYARILPLFEKRRLKVDVISLQNWHHIVKDFPTSLNNRTPVEALLEMSGRNHIDIEELVLTASVPSTDTMQHFLQPGLNNGSYGFSKSCRKMVNLKRATFDARPLQTQSHLGSTHVALFIFNLRNTLEQSEKEQGTIEMMVKIAAHNRYPVTVRINARQLGAFHIDTRPWKHSEERVNTMQSLKAAETLWSRILKPKTQLVQEEIRNSGVDIFDNTFPRNQLRCLRSQHVRIVMYQQNYIDVTPASEKSSPDAPNDSIIRKSTNPSPLAYHSYFTLYMDDRYLSLYMRDSDSHISTTYNLVSLHFEGIRIYDTGKGAHHIKHPLSMILQAQRKSLRSISIKNCWIRPDSKGTREPITWSEALIGGAKHGLPVLKTCVLEDLKDLSNEEGVPPDTLKLLSERLLSGEPEKYSPTLEEQFKILRM